jgi:hypothetical protein
MVFATACQAHMAGTKSARHAIFMMVSMGDLVSSVRASAARLGISPVDLLTAMSYETGGKLDPNQWGGAGGRYLGLIQFGPEEQRKYGVKPGMWWHGSD